MHINLDDPFLVDKIVSEVKSQGVFDQFRKDCMSDVDTKPAYQNLRQRVESSVAKFLSEQSWTPDTNKIQLREKLRKHFTETGFLETGVERIVDQVVNPKISTIFQPKIEDIAYKYLGIEKPVDEIGESTSSCANGTVFQEIDLLPKDLEAVSSPDSVKESDNKSNELINLNDTGDKIDDEEESPPFELLEGRPPSPDREETNESELSGISGLTSQDSVKSEVKIFPSKQVEECQLSQVSSSSHLSIVTTEDEEFGASSKQAPGPGNDLSEEAQMPKVFENSDLNQSKSLHFDIKKDEIKFEGNLKTSTDFQNEFKEINFSISERNSTFINLPSKSDIEVEINSIETHQSDPASQNSSSELPQSSGSDNDSERALKIMTDVSQSQSNSIMSSGGIKNEKNEMPGADVDAFDANSCEGKRSHLQNSNSKIDFEKKDNLDEKIKSDESCSEQKTKKTSKSQESTNNSHSSTTNSHRHQRTSSSSRKNKDKDRIRDKDRHRTSSRSRSHSHSHKSRKPHSHSKNDKSKGNGKENSHKRKRSKERKEKPKDDHSSARKKPNRRKSTDSNDDGGNIKERNKSTRMPSVTTIASTECGNNSKSSDTPSNNTNFDASEPQTQNKRSYISSYDNKKFELNLKPAIIVDELLNNNNLNHIELEIGNNYESSTNFLRINHKKLFEKLENVEEMESNDDFNGFSSDSENEKNSVRTKLELLSTALNQNNNCNLCLRCSSDYKQTFNNLSICVIDVVELVLDVNFLEKPRKNINTLEQSKKVYDFNYTLEKDSKRKIMNGQHFSNEKRKRLLDNFPTVKNVTDDQVYNCNDSSLLFNYDDENMRNIKKVKSLDLDHHRNISPIHSESSISSKENDCITSIDKRKMRNVTIDKIIASAKSSQRYSSEDLYKPRPILSQRSKRRGVDIENCNF